MYLIRLVKYHVSSSSTPLSYNINEKKNKKQNKTDSRQGPPPVWSLHIVFMAAWASPRAPVSSLIAEMCT